MVGLKFHVAGYCMAERTGAISTKQKSDLNLPVCIKESESE